MVAPQGGHVASGWHCVPADTEAVAALAFACMERERLVGPGLAAELRAATRGVRRRMVEAQGEDGFFGNVYSTPWAMQVGVSAGVTGAGGAAGRVGVWDMGVGGTCVQDGGWAQGAGSRWVPRRAQVKVWVQTWPGAVTHLRLLSHHLLPSRSQVFIATNTCRAQPAYGRAMAALLENLDAFSTAATIAQALPALHGRSYLDIAAMQCHDEPSRSCGEPGWRWHRCHHAGHSVSISAMVVFYLQIR